MDRGGGKGKAKDIAGGLVGAWVGLVLLGAPLASASPGPPQDQSSTSTQSQQTTQNSNAESVKPDNPESPKIPTAKTREPLEKLAWAMLVAGINDEKVQKRTAAITALGAVGPQPRAVRSIEETLKDKDSYVRELAATTLVKMKARHSIPRLRK